MNRPLKVVLLAAGLSAVLAAQTQAVAATPEETLYHWGECAVALGVYQAMSEQGGDNAGIRDGYARFQPLVPRMKKHVDGLADSLGEEASNRVMERIKTTYTPVLAEVVAHDDPAVATVKTFGPILDRCVREAAALPEA